MLRGAIVEDTKILPCEALDQSAAAVGDDHANVHALHGDVDGRLGSGRFLRFGRRGTKKQREHGNGTEQGAAH